MTNLIQASHTTHVNTPTSRADFSHSSIRLHTYSATDVTSTIPSLVRVLFHFFFAVNFLFNSINIPHLFIDFMSIAPAVFDINIVWSKFCKSHSHLVCVSLLVRLYPSFSFDVSHLYWPSPLVETIRTGSKAGSGKEPCWQMQKLKWDFLVLTRNFLQLLIHVYGQNLLSLSISPVALKRRS